MTKKLFVLTAAAVSLQMSVAAPSAFADDGVCVSPDVLEPVVVSRTPPEYPSLALRRNRVGTVESTYDINLDGTVDNIQLVETPVRMGFGRAVTQALRDFVYEPPLDAAGNAVKICGVQFSFDFVLD